MNSRVQYLKLWSLNCLKRFRNGQGAFVFRSINFHNWNYRLVICRDTGKQLPRNTYRTKNFLPNGIDYKTLLLRQHFE